jgi:menaquinone-dependent protoporphyrinogen oxidase
MEPTHALPGTEGVTLTSASDAKMVAVLYATREGHTAKIAEHVAAELRTQRLQAEVHQVGDGAAASALSRCAGVLLAGSVHLGRHERELVSFIKQHRAELEHLPAAFLSVSLSEAGAERADAPADKRATARSEVRRLIDELFEHTGWHPAHVRPVAGALMYSKYNVLVRFVMKRIAKAEGASTDTSRDHEYTDWVTLDRFIDELAQEIRAAPASPGPDRDVPRAAHER